MKQKKGVIAAGHPETAKAAGQILQDGGNAFDAVVAAQLMAFVAEPVLTSLGGGGFLLAEKASGKQVLYDFFVQSPLQKRNPSQLRFYPITADFGETQQEFHIGQGSIATPGMVKGLFEIHRDLCSLPMKRLAEPAIRLARKGLQINHFQSGIFDIIKPIYLASPDATQIFRGSGSEDELVQEGEHLKQLQLADFMEQLVADGESLFYEGEIADSITRNCRENGGHLTPGDFQNYQVFRRDPLKINYRNHHIAINPPPASGGILIAFALKLMESMDPEPFQFGSESWLDLLVYVQKMTNKARVDSFVDHPSDDPVQKLLDPDYLEIYRQEIRNRAASFRGTTQISIADRDGNMASLTSSNGEGSGVMIPGIGVMLNNMLGEKDLNPGGFHNWRTNERVTSMMAPGIMKMNDNTHIVFGSGGSNRIRTAILQVLLNLADFGMPLKKAVDSPRIHCEVDQLNVENGFSSDQLVNLAKDYPNHKIWKEKSLFFGGAHSVSYGPDGFSGAGDSRRGGVSVIV
jgi:gamma-glutamyltranspeptidase/glutathione hydrolase